MSQCSFAKHLIASLASVPIGSWFTANIIALEFACKLADGFKRAIALENMSDGFGFVLVNHQLSVLNIIAER